MMLRSGLAPKPFSCFGSSDRLIFSVSLTMWTLHSSFSLFLQYFFSSCACTQILRGIPSSIKEKLIPHWTKPLTAADLIVLFSKIVSVKQSHVYSREQFLAQFGNEVMTKQDSGMTQSVLAVSAIQIWSILKPLQWSSGVQLLPGLFWVSLGWPALITHGQSGHCSWLIQTDDNA